ncbi:glycerophosphodiester phosphodiesterase [Halocatena salina]|uniref:Glycerophosphodiester phosphodiesterase n=1 Tax=Halocatena salina TaxID=2934340 RepID=A0A8T9ZYD7_9EURY|nr:glycerophosphodiester phosphodiesterase [Halocatena salina]UPM41672.1 glycerophosphodiester phosphodiesterase [Halocatena salina]
MAGTRFGGIETAAARRDGRGEQRTVPSIIAHRGFAGAYPENTVLAARLSSGLSHSSATNDTTRQNHDHERGGDLGIGAEMIEIDVMPTADGDVVVFHDDRLAGRDGGEQGLTDASGVVWETPTETVLKAEVLESGETVPLLDELLAAVPSHVGVNVEFKNPGSFDLRLGESLDETTLERQKELWRPFTQDVLPILADHDHQFLISSFYEAALATVREIEPSLPVAFLFWDSISDGLDVTRRYDCEAIHPPRNMIQNTPFFEDEYYTSGPFADIDLVEVAHAEDRMVNVFTVETWYQASQLAAAGVDGLINDYPGLLAI